MGQMLSACAFRDPFRGHFGVHLLVGGSYVWGFGLMPKWDLLIDFNSIQDETPRFQFRKYLISETCFPRQNSVLIQKLSNGQAPLKVSCK